MHTCADNWARVHRLMLALIRWDDEAYRFAMAELGDCPRCLRAALDVAVYLHTNAYALRAGSLDQAADDVADELARLL